MNNLSDMPNIGKTLEKKLIKVGIKTPVELIETGSENAIIKIRAIDESACFNMLCALEGAIQGIRWHGITKERKEELKQFLENEKYPNMINP